MSDYLWDRSGQPDPEIADLETLLQPFRLRSAKPPVIRRTRWAPRAAAIAAGVLIAGAVAFQLSHRNQGEPSGWWMLENDRRQVASGETILAPKQALVTLQADDIGRIELQPGSEVQILNPSTAQESLKLRQGRLRALIWAPPGRFAVRTDSVRAIDLGCQYELSIDRRGDGLVRVEIGWVAFQNGRDEAFIPAGAACRTRRARGPGYPYFEDATEPFRTALARFEQSGDPGALSSVLANARREDGLTLWHLLERADQKLLPEIFDRFAKLEPLPKEVKLSEVMTREAATMDLCWNALGLESAAWWREWKREWREE